MITDDDIILYTEGSCHTLALAIHKHAGWPVWAFHEQSYRHPRAYPKGLPDLHAFVQRPDGMFVDVEGLHTEDEMKFRWLSDYEVTTADYEMHHVEDITIFERDAWGPLCDDHEPGYIEKRANRLARYLVRTYK